MDPLTLASIAMSLGGGLMKAGAARRAATAQAAQDRFNAHLADVAAADAKARGAVAEGQVKSRTSETVAGNESQLAASGVDVQQGSALSTLSAQRAKGAFAALVVRSNAAKEAWGYEQQGTNFRSRADYALQAGDAEALSDIIGGVSGAVGAARGSGSSSGVDGSAPYSPGVTAPLIRVGEPTVPEAWMGSPLSAWNGTY